MNIAKNRKPELNPGITENYYARTKQSISDRRSD